MPPTHYRFNDFKELTISLHSGSLASRRHGPREAGNHPAGPSGSEDVAPRAGPREAGNGPAGRSSGSRPRRPETHGTAATELLVRGGGKRFSGPPPPCYKSFGFKNLGPRARTRDSRYPGPSRDSSYIPRSRRNLTRRSKGSADFLPLHHWLK